MALVPLECEALASSEGLAKNPHRCPIRAHPPQRFFTESLAVSETLGPRGTSNRGCPLRRWGTQWKCSGTACAFLTSAPLVTGGPRVEPPIGGSHFGPSWAVSSGRRFSTSPGTYLPARQTSPESTGLKAKSSGTSGGDASCLRQGVPSGDLLAARQTPPPDSTPSVSLPRASL